MDAVFPGVAKGLYLFRLSADIGLVAILDVATLRRNLPVAVKFYAVGRVEKKALHLATQALALGEARHHLQAVTQDHAIRPVSVVLVESVLDPVRRQTVEISKHVRRIGLRLARLGCATPEIGNDSLRLDLLLDVKRRDVDHEVGPILLDLA